MNITASMASDYSKKNISDTMTSQITNQKNIPIIEMGALLFYSGNFLLDLGVNFIFAIPEMIGLLLHGIAFLFDIDNTIMNNIQLFVTGIMGVLYVLGLLQMMLSIRSGGSNLA